MATISSSAFTGIKPSQRRLRVFTFDPGAQAQLETFSIGELTLEVTWEDNLASGPVGEYIEVIDYDPASGGFYAPVDLNHPYLLAQNGLSPAEGGPQFHQQMVYAVAMNTIDHFERALGRVALWAHRVVRDAQGRATHDIYVPRLRIFPHALREANAYYSPEKKALLFGYFPTRGSGPGQVPGGMVFTCLSYDIVAHETTHALLDGLHPSFNEATNLDVYALHEGFADIVALFQRFAHPEVLEHQIARTKGNLERQNLLGQLAQQFGLALGMRGALRKAIGGINEKGEWELQKPDPEKIRVAREPHERGGILLAAVFSAFLSIYKMRSADLLRIATNGTGVLNEGDIHPDFVKRLAKEAASVADAVLTMCIRGLDYCPPVDIDFGTYLRGVVTADSEVFPQDANHYRVAFIEAFRQWGIYPDGVRSMSESDLRYPSVGHTLGQSGQRDLKALKLDWDLTANREQVWGNMEKNARIVHQWLLQPAMRNHLPAFGLNLSNNAPPSVFRALDGLPSLEVHSVRVARRRGYRDTIVPDLVVEIRQRRRGYFDREMQKKVDGGNQAIERGVGGDFRFRRGCTLIIDPVSQQIRYAITTRGDITDNDELERVRQFLTGQSSEVENPFYGGNLIDPNGEHFALVHRHQQVVADF